MPNILAIETSVPAASIALQTNEGNLFQEGFESHRQQNQLLFAPLKGLLAQLGAEQKLDAILVGTGPGSYSGTRISIAAAQGIAVAHDYPVVGISSFLATKTWLSGQDAIAVGDARRGAYFISNIPAGGLPHPPKLMDRETFDKELTETSAAIFTLEPKIELSVSINPKLETPTATQHIEAWLKLSDSNKQKLIKTPPSPTYLRAPFITKAKPGHPLLRGKVKGQ